MLIPLKERDKVVSVSLPWWASLCWLKANKLHLNVDKTEFMFIRLRQKLQSLTGYTMNIHIDSVPINQSHQSLSLMKISHGRPTFMKSHETYPLVSVLLSRSGHLFQCTLQLKYTKVLSSHTSIIAALYGMAIDKSVNVIWLISNVC